MLSAGDALDFVACYPRGCFCQLGARRVAANGTVMQESLDGGHLEEYPASLGVGSGGGLSRGQRTRAACFDEVRALL